MLDKLKEKISVWEKLKQTTKPILIYGMGDGALKILKIFEEYDIKISGIFASDEFVRGHSFAGFKVLTYSQATEQFGDFVIVLAFASYREPMLTHLKQMSTKNEFYAPDVPVVMQSTEVFNHDYVLKHLDKFTQVYDILEDEISRKTFIDVINFKISGKIDYLFNVTSEVDEMYKNIIKPHQNEVYVDLGAYNGDTVSEFLSYTNKNYEKIICFEPDKKNYKKLCKLVEENTLDNCNCYNIGAWSDNDTLCFAGKAGRNSTLTNQGTTQVAVNSVDNILNGEKATSIKFDVEGAEYQSLLGCKNTIKNFKPKLLVSAYHKNEDLFALPLLIKQLNPDYKIFLRHHPYIPAWETNFYAI